MIFLVQYAAAGRHPLHIARSDHAAVTGRILVLDLAIINDGHRLEATMGMLANTTTFRSRCEIMGAGIVQQQEWADMLAQAMVGKKRANGETIAYPVAMIIAITAHNFLGHLTSPDRPTPFCGPELAAKMILQR